MNKMNLRKTTVASITNLELRKLKGGITLISIDCITTGTNSRPTDPNATNNPRSGGGRL